MAKPFRRLIDDLPTDRRERIERHAKALVAEYELLKALRRDRDMSQEQLADHMGIRQASVSKIENQNDMRLSTLRKYVEALGGELDIRIRFSDRDVRIDAFRDWPDECSFRTDRTCGRPDRKLRRPRCEESTTLLA